MGHDDTPSLTATTSASTNDIISVSTTLNALRANKNNEAMISTDTISLKSSRSELHSVTSSATTLHTNEASRAAQLKDSPNYSLLSTPSATQPVDSGSTKQVSRNVDYVPETAIGSRGLRPMHLKVSVRIHHVSFLHPGLDTGGSNPYKHHSGNNKWKFFKSGHKIMSGGTISGADTPGILTFGSKKGTWTNAVKQNVFKMSSSMETDKDRTSATPVKKYSRQGSYIEGDGGIADTVDLAEIFKIITAESFRLSRDGIIQQHYTLLKDVDTKHSNPPLRRGSMAAIEQLSTRFLFNQKSDDLSSRGVTNAAMSDVSDAARYYRECAKRPKGYRRLVVSSRVPTNDVIIPTRQKRYSMESSMLNAMRKTSKAGVTVGSENVSNLLRKQTWDFEGSNEENPTSWSSSKNGQGEVRDENLFNNVEYRYIGPPNTGPAFFKLLRCHGAATFGRYLPEIACSVPNHSVGFELRKSRRRCVASTQPIIIEAPHVIWGHARDKMLSDVAKEGCPLIDARKFEYVSNENLEEAEKTESLMVCGATVWVQNVKDEDGRSITSASTLKSKMAKAEYYRGKVVEEVREGMTKRTKGVIKVGKIGLNGVGKVFVGDQSHGDIASVSSIDTQSSKKRNMNVKVRTIRAKLRKKFKLKNKQLIGEGIPCDDSISSKLDEASVGSGSIANISETASVQVHDNTNLNSCHEEGEEFLSLQTDETQAVVTPEHAFPDYTIMNPAPYVLVVDDMIKILIVSFPDKEVLAKFPISVASILSQRSLEDRMSNPFEPSELTSTLIQEPLAAELQWGIELKVTIRAVEVKPHVPRIVLPTVNFESMGEPMDILQSELKKVKHRLIALGKSDEEIQQAMELKEKEIFNRENELDVAILAVGMGKGEYGGACPEEIRKRQMFFDEREHKCIQRRVERRGQLTNSQATMLRDALIEPSPSSERSENNEEQEILRLLNIHFPGVEEGCLALHRKRIRASQKSAPLPSIDEVCTIKNDSEVSMHDDVTEDVFNSINLAIAESMDKCLGGLMTTATVPLVRATLSQQKCVPNEERKDSVLTSNFAKQWCWNLAQKLSLSVTTDGDSKQKVSELQNVLLKNAGSSLANCTIPSSEVDEKQRTNCSDGYLSEVIDWCSTVASKLDACADELDNQDDDDPTSSSLRSDRNSFMEPSNADNQGTGRTENKNDDPLSVVSKSPFSLKDTLTPVASIILPQTLKKRHTVNDDDSMDSSANSSLLNHSSKNSNLSKSSERILQVKKICTLDEAISSGKSFETSKSMSLIKLMRKSHFDIYHSVHHSSMDVSNEPKVTFTSENQANNPNANIYNTLGAIPFFFIIATLLLIGAFQFKYIGLEIQNVNLIK